MILIYVTWKFLPVSSLTTYSALTERWKFKGLASVMLRNGILYFVVLSLFNVLQLILTLAFPVVPDGILFDVWYFTFPLSSLLVSHFLLDLQEAHQRRLAGLATDDYSNTSHNVDSIQFADALGSVGAFFDHAADSVQGGGDGVNVGDDDDDLVPAETCRPDEGEPNPESRGEGEFETAEVSHVEDEFAITEVLRVGGGEATVGAHCTIP